MPEIKNSQIVVHFQSKKKKYDKIENFGQIKEIQKFINFAENKLKSFYKSNGCLRYEL